MSPQLFKANNGYAEELLGALMAATERILLETMDLDCFGVMADILEACEQARRRGVAVTIVYDKRSSHRSVRRDYGRAARAQLCRRINQLKQAGAVVYSVGAYELNPFAGRHHAKVVVIDGNAYIGGGVNLSGRSFKAHDFMLRYDNPKLAQILYDTLPLAATTRTHDQHTYKDATTEVLLDAGVKKQSVIYDHALRLAERSIKAWYVSKLAPDGRLLRLLQQVNTLYWYNVPMSSDMFDTLAILIDQLKMRVPNLYKSKTTLHAKFCVFQLPDGTYEAITGSHNFNSRGVNFGTQELAVQTKDQKLCAALIEFAANLPK